MYKVIEMIEMRRRANALNLAAQRGFWIDNASRLASICNGFGPDRWSEKAREVMTWIWRNFQEAAMIHDWEYEHSDGLEASCNEADERFYTNCKILLADLYPAWKVWLLPVRAIAFVKIRLAYNALRLYGLDAWIEAYKRKR